MSDISTMVTEFIERVAGDEELRNKALAIITSGDKDAMPGQLMDLAEEAGVPFTAEGAMKLLEDPEVMAAIGLDSNSGLGSLLNMAKGFLGGDK